MTGDKLTNMARDYWRVRRRLAMFRELEDLRDRLAIEVAFIEAVIEQHRARMTAIERELAARGEPVPARLCN